MTLEKQVSQQRVKHIVSSYQLDGEQPEAFVKYLEELLQSYATPLIELALAETLVGNWLNLPMQRGIGFLQQAHDRLQQWETESIISTLTPEQFQQVTGLDPSPIFGSSELPPSPSIVHPC
jgi:hypothetical protein